ncbi:MAG: hypothetical protein IJ681_00200 [Bacteroidales bacterium]|nr:hypothetical protein [Bacteroidales bacterium]
MGIIAMIQAFFESISKVAECKKSNNEFGAEKDVLKTKKRLDKKANEQEDLILDMAKIICKYQNSFERKDRMLAKCCLRKIKRLN